MSCVGCVGANYTKLAQNQQLKNDTCAAFSEELLSAFHIANNQGFLSDPPTMLCNKCYLTMKHVTTAAIHKKPYKCGLKPYDWYNHTITDAVRVCLLLRHDGASCDIWQHSSPSCTAHHDHSTIRNHSKFHCTTIGQYTATFCY